MTILSKVDKRGRVTLPSSLRQAMELKVGDCLTFSQLTDGTVIIRAKNRRLADLAGALTTQDQPTVSIDEMRR